MNAFKICWRKRVIFITLILYHVLPVSNIIGCNLTNLLFSEIWKNFLVNNIVFRLPCMFTYFMFHSFFILGCQIFKRHIEIGLCFCQFGAFIFQRCFLCGKSTLNLPFSFTSPILIVKRSVPSSSFFVLICWHGLSLLSEMNHHIPFPRNTFY